MPKKKSSKRLPTPCLTPDHHNIKMLYLDYDVNADINRAHLEVVNVPPKYFINNDDVKSIAPALKSVADFSAIDSEKYSQKRNTTDIEYQDLEKDPWNYIPGTIPLILDSKSESLIKQLTDERNRFKRQKTQGRLQLKTTEAAEGDATQTANSGLESQLNKKVEEIHFIELHKFTQSVKENLNQQILSLSITKFPKYSNNITEKFLNSVITDFLIPEFNKNHKYSYHITYKWSSSNNDNSEYRIIYIKFEILTDSKKIAPVYSDFVNLDDNTEFKYEFLKNVFINFLDIMNGLKLSYRFKDEFNRNKVISTKLNVAYENNTDKLIQVAKGKIKLNEDEKTDNLKKSDESEGEKDNSTPGEAKNEKKNEDGTEIDKVNTEKTTVSKTEEDQKDNLGVQSTFVKDARSKILELLKQLMENTAEEEDPSDYSDISHKVNLKELSDLPKRMVPQIIEDIKNFRLSIIKIEKKKQAKKLAEDRRRAKLQIKKMYLSIKQAKKKGRNSGDAEEMDIDDEDDDDYDEGQQDEDMSDSEYENIREDAEQEKIEKEFLRQEAQMKHIESLTKRKLLSKFKEVDNYASEVESRLKSNFEDYEILFAGHEDQDEVSFQKHIYSLDQSKLHNAQISNLINMYHTNKSSYLQMRTIEKIEEEKRDEEDRHKEIKEKASQEQSLNFLSSVLGSSGVTVSQEPSTATSLSIAEAPATAVANASKAPIKLQIKQKIQPDQPEEQKQAAENKPVIESINFDSVAYKLSNGKLSQLVKKIKPFVDELLIEYLGMTEDDLVAFITSSIENRKPKAEIVNELTETFDEDTEVFMEKLWRKLEDETIK